MFDHFDWIAAMRQSPVMLVILACSVLTFGFALERFLYYWARRGSPFATLATARELARSGRTREAIWTLHAVRHPACAVAATVIESAHLPADAQEEKLQIALSEQRLQLDRHLGLIGTMGNTAPLIGLLGTVWGIMRAFHDMARTGSAGPSVVAAGVAEALFTTAAGLCVAVPAVMLYNHLVRRMGVMLTTAENQARDLRIGLTTESSSDDEREHPNAAGGTRPVPRPAIAPDTTPRAQPLARPA